ncbi:MAG TPA: hypothetical protein VG095_00645, partial [Chthoniobacterales bacterium]|nr:hypothetical protein [Chthoniobacterales bacterium]
MPLESRESRQPFQVVFAMAAVLIVAATLTLRTVAHPAELRPTSDDPTPFGYTWSLLLFLLPIAALGWWFARRSDLKFPRAAFWRTIAVLAPLGFVLDLLFGNAFFVFQNEAATIRCDIPALGGGIPIEEFIFYLTGFILTLLSYVWCDEYWMAAYNVPDYEAAVHGIDRIVRFHFPSLLIGSGLIVAAIVYRKWFSGDPNGFPWYFIYLTVASFIPSIGFFKTAHRFINWRAFSFTFFLLLLISLLWEVTLALPYGWWDYRAGAMSGLYIGAWRNLPIEAVLVWLAVTY